jgi:peptidyl-prolyl cis-trans isomerase A (cyclophilin A)
MKLLLTLLLLSSFAFAADAKPVRVLLHTTLGDIEPELDAAHAPKTTANFLRYVEAGLYNGGEFHRTVTMNNQPQNNVKIQVIQGGIPTEREKDVFSPIALERTSQTGIKHRDGTVSMARSEPDSATSDFFICVGDQPELDFGGKRNPDGQGFAAFGKVIRGMDVVRKIHGSPAEGQKLTPSIRIINATVVK